MSDGSVPSKSSGPLTPPAKHKKVVRCRCDHEGKIYIGTLMVLVVSR